MDDRTFAELIEAAKRGETFTDMGASADEDLALTLIASASPRQTPRRVEAAWAAHRGEAPFDSLSITDLLA